MELKQRPTLRELHEAPITTHFTQKKSPVSHKRLESQVSDEETPARDIGMFAKIFGSKLKYVYVTEDVGDWKMLARGITITITITHLELIFLSK